MTTPVVPITYQEIFDRLSKLPKYKVDCINPECNITNCDVHCIKCGSVDCVQHDINSVQFSNIQYDEKNVCFTQNIQLSCGNFMIHGPIKFIHVPAYKTPFTPIDITEISGIDLYASIMSAFTINKNIDKAQHKSISDLLDSGFKHFDKTFGNSAFTNVRPIKPLSNVLINYADNKHISLKYSEFTAKFYELNKSTECVEHAYALLVPKTINYKIDHNLHTITSEIKLVATISISTAENTAGVHGRYQYNPMETFVKTYYNTIINNNK